MRLRFLTRIFSLLLLATLTRTAPAAELEPAVENWLKAQAGIQTWSADVVQTRYLKTLAQPLTATGHVWFVAPNRFRWELGQPAKTIALRTKGEMFLFYPALKRVEKYSLDKEQPGPWRDASALFDAGFPRSRTELEQQFDVVSQNATNGMFEVVLKPKTAGGRRLMPRLAIWFDPAGSRLLATELEFGDGSRMRNEFSNQKVNEPVPESTFSTEIPDGYKVIEPAKAGPVKK